MAKQAKQNAGNPAKMKPSYEELVSIMTKMDAALKDKMKMENIQEVSARLTFMFKIVENKDMFPESYVNDCVSDIIRLLPVNMEQEETDGDGEQK